MATNLPKSTSPSASFPQTRADIYRQRLSLIRSVYGDLFDAEFVAAEPRRDERELAIEILSNCSGQYYDPTFWDATNPQKIIDMSIDKAAKILASSASAAPMKQTPEPWTVVKKSDGHWWIITPLGNDLADCGIGEGNARAIAEAMTYKFVASQPQPSAGQTEGK